MALPYPSPFPLSFKLGLNRHAHRHYPSVLEAGGAEMSATVAAASAALAQAGVAMRDLVSACSVARVCSPSATSTSTASTTLLDPTTAEEAASDGGVTIAHMATLGEATQVVVTGSWVGRGSRRFSSQIKKEMNSYTSGLDPSRRSG